MADRHTAAELSAARFQESAKAFGATLLGIGSDPAELAEKNPMRITAIAVAGLVAGTLMTASPAQADPSSEVQELQQQISELHDNWDSLTPDQRNLRIAQLQQQVTTVDRDIQTLPPDQRAAVEAPLVPSTLELADLLRKAQASAPQPCVLFFGPPPCGI